MHCSICLEILKMPVVTPCGHIFCMDCLISSSQTSPDATQAPCPTCRSSFSLVTPNPMFIPDKYRQFIDSNIRRIYVDDSKTRRLQDRISRLEARVKSLESQKDLLMVRCESSMRAAENYSEREREARLRCNSLEKELRQANNSIQLANAETRRLRHGSSLTNINVPRVPPIQVKDSRRHAVSVSSTNNKPSPVVYENADESNLSLKRRRVTRNPSQHSMPVLVPLVKPKQASSSFT